MGEEEEERIQQIETDRVDIATPQVDIRANGLQPSITKEFTRLAFFKGLGSFLMGAAMLCLVIIVWVQSDNLERNRAENACRFDVSTDVNSIADNIDALTAEIFVEAIRSPSTPENRNPKVTSLGRELEREIRKLRPAIEAREQATVTCREGN